ncbi:MAG: lactonase family protein [Lachnospiraceae bacterium]|nr:lactonase family protein [Lachnospiraceae bacterium]
MLKTFVYISSWNNFGGEPGIGVYELEPSTGELRFCRMMNQEDSCNASFVSQEKRILYVCNEVANIQNINSGAILTYQILDDGSLKEMDRTLTFCPNPTFIAMDKTGQKILVSNHSGFGAVSKIRKDAFGKYYMQTVQDDAVVNLFEVNEDGRIGELLDVAKHTGSGIRPQQKHARPHCVVKSPIDDLFAVCDKGNDSIYMYKLAEDKLVLCDVPYKDIPGSMPRYCVFHPKKRILFVNYEGNTALSSFKYDEQGKITLLFTAEGIACADHSERDISHDEQQGLAIHPNGKYIYDMINGPEVIAVFEVDEETGKMILIQNQKVSRGKWLRGGTVSPDGRYLITTCMKSGDIEVFRIQEDGMLETTGRLVNQSAAAYVTYVKL